MLYLPIIIVGSPRSGTNMLRDVLTTIPGVSTWPCDEINYIWRHGNRQFPSDEFTVAMASTPVQTYVRRQFDRIARRNAAKVVVEKTCANSLRVDFVDRILPNAKYIFIRRDGFDAVGSATQRWNAPMDVRYLLKKSRFVPLSDVAYYTGRFLKHRLHQLFSADERPGLWGPQLMNMDELLAHFTLEEVCALQWQRCVNQTAAAFERIDPDRYVEVEYETFVQQPAAELRRIVALFRQEIVVDDATIRAAVARVSARSVGKGRDALGEPCRTRLITLIGNTLSRYGYA